MMGIVITALGTLLLGIVPQHLNAQSAKPKPANFSVAIENSPEKAPTEAELRKALEKPLAAEFENVPLDVILRQVAEAIGQNVVIDGQALRAEGVAIDTPISHHGKPIAAARLLDRVLEPLGLTWVIEHHVVSVTTIIAAEGIYITRIYPVGDLLDYAKTHRQHVSKSEIQGLHFVQFENISPCGEPPDNSPGGWLIDLIQGMTTGQAWDEIDGFPYGAISLIKNRLVIRTTFRRQEKCARIIEALRQFTKGRSADRAVAIRPWYYPPKEDQQVRQALKSVVTANFKELTLERFLSIVSKAIDVPIHLDRHALKEEGVAIDEPISRDVKNVPARSLLTINLKPLGLCFVVEDGRVLVTTMIAAEERAYAKFYDVRDLNQAGFETQKLLEVLQDETNGNWLTYANFGHNPRATFDGLLAIYQTDRVHQEIEVILDSLRKPQPVER